MAAKLSFRERRALFQGASLKEAAYQGGETLSGSAVEGGEALFQGAKISFREALFRGAGGEGLFQGASSKSLVSRLGGEALFQGGEALFQGASSEVVAAKLSFRERRRIPLSRLGGEGGEALVQGASSKELLSWRRSSLSGSVVLSFLSSWRRSSLSGSVVEGEKKLCNAAATVFNGSTYVVEKKTYQRT